MLSLKTKILAFLTAIGAAILAIWAYRSGKDKAEDDAMYKALDGLEGALKRSDEVASASASAHNQAVEQANAARKEEDEKHDQNVAAVRDAASVSLRDGSDAVNAAIIDTNRSL